jgi:hypothetical protein
MEGYVNIPPIFFNLFVVVISELKNYLCETVKLKHFKLT